MGPMREDRILLGFVLECHADRTWTAYAEYLPQELIAHSVLVATDAALDDMDADGGWASVRCMACGTRWEAVYPADTAITALVCPGCRERAATIRVVGDPARVL